MPACITYNANQIPIARCQHLDSCHSLRHAPCETLLPWEADPSIQVPPSSLDGPCGRNRADHMSWPHRRRAILDLADDYGYLTSTMVADDAGSSVFAARKWLKRLTNEGAIILIAQAQQGVKGHPARYILNTEAAMRAFSPNGNVTFEICPVCQTPDVKVEHGQEVELVIEIAHDTNVPMHYWHCPKCGDSVAIVCFYCESCNVIRKEL